MEKSSQALGGVIRPGTKKFGWTRPFLEIARRGTVAQFGHSLLWWFSLGEGWAGHAWGSAVEPGLRPRLLGRSRVFGLFGLVACWARLPTLRLYCPRYPSLAWF